MNEKVEQFPAKNPNPVLSVAKDGTVLYSNEAGEPLLHFWGSNIGEKLPPDIRDFVQKVISRNSPEKMEIKTGQRVYLIVFHPLPEQDYVNISRFDISDQKEFEDRLRESEDRVIENVDLAEIIDVKAVKPLMDNLYRLVHIPIGINDLKGNVLAGVGWQEICTKFHRVNPKTFKHCVESDSKLSSGVPPGEFKLYKCKNNMYDIVTPIMVGSQHVGYVFGGQFFFDDEPLDYELFRFQARKYGFDEEEYIAALEKVPRLSRETVKTGMSFFMTFANLLSQLSYSNIKLTQSLLERDTLLEELRKSELKYRNIIEIAREGIWSLDCNDRTVFVNQKVSEMLGYSIDEILGQLPQKFLAPEYRDVADNRLLEHRQRVQQPIDYRFIRKDGSDLWCILSTRPLFDDERKYAGSLGMLTDITERKRTEEALQESEEKYRNIVETANEGVWVFNSVSKTTYVNEKMANMLGYSREEMIGSFIWDYANEKDKDFFHFRLANRKQGIDEVYECRLLRKGGSYIWLIVSAKSYFNKDGKFAGSLGMFTDITERKKAEEALRLSNNYNRSLIEASLDPLVTIGRGGKITDVNNATEQVTGYLRSELIGTDFSDYFTEPEEASKGYEQVFTDGKVWDYPLEIRHKDGHATPVLYNASIYRDEKGDVIGIFAAARDITKRKIAEDKLKEIHENLERLVGERTAELEKAYSSLKESEERLAEAQRIAHIGNWDWNIDTNGLYWSDEIYRIFGCSPQEFGATYDAFLNFVHPEDREYVNNAVIEALNRKPYSIEHRIILANGKERIVHEQGEVIFNEKNIPIRMMGTVQDITERKRAEVELQKAEERYRIVTEQTGQLVYDNNLKNNVVFWAGAIEEVFGYNPKEVKKFNLEDWIEHIHPEDKGFVLEKFMQARKLGGRDYVEYRLRKKDGTYIYVSDTGTYLKNKDGMSCRVLGVIKDITQRKKTEETLARIEVVRKQEIHHRIKNNLQVISSLLDLQAEKFKGRKGITDEEILSAFRDSQNRVISMALIHEELYKGGEINTLNFSKYIAELADNLFLTYSLRNENISLYTDIEEDIFFDMDTSVPLGIIINELVSNSLKHAFSGKVKGEIRIKLNREENGECISESFKSSNFLLSIYDNGVGIPENLNIEDLNSLGLQLVTSLVDQLDGELELKRDKGTEFIIRFTVTEKDNQESETALQN